MSINVSLSASVEKYLMQAESNIKSNVDKAITQASFLVKNKAVRNIQGGQRSGVEYVRGSGDPKRKGNRRRKGAKKVIGTRSAQGEFPKSDTGVLAQSISASRMMFAVSIVGTHIPYGHFLETKDPSNGGRPWLEPSYEEEMPKIDKLIYNAARKGLNP